jgi:hypothetical protein
MERFDPAMANLRLRYKQQLGKNAPENHYGNNQEWLEAAIAKSCSEESKKRKREEEPSQGFWEEHRTKFANPTNAIDENMEAEAIKGGLAASKAKDAGHAFGNISAEMKKIAAALSFAIRKRKANYLREEMSPDKLAEAVFEMIQQAIGDRQIAPDYDIAGALKFTLEKINLHQHIIDLTAKVDEQQKLYRKKQAEIKHYQEIARKARTMLEDADKGVPAMPEVAAAPQPSKRVLKRCPSLPITASREKLKQEDDAALANMEKIQAELDASF